MEGKNSKEVGIPEISTSAESTLTTIGSIILSLGIFATSFLALVALQAADLMGLAGALVTLLSSLATWALLRVIANISLRLKAIQETMSCRLITEAEVKEVEAEEQKAEENKIKSNFTIGETILYKGRKFQIENVSETTGKICINKGLFAGYAWLYPEEVSKVEE